MARGARAPGSPGPGGGHSLVELLVVLAILGILAGLGGLGRPPGNPALAAVQGELRASVEQAFHLARARGRPVRLALAAPAPEGGDSGLHPLNLPRGVRWGLPPEVPLPPGMKDTLRAQVTGRRPRLHHRHPLAHRHRQRLVPHRRAGRGVPAPGGSRAPHAPALAPPPRPVGARLNAGRSRKVHHAHG